MSERRIATLRQRVFKAGGWTLAGFLVNYAIRFGSSLAMTRLLAPEVFGVMAIATMVMTALAMFSDIGLRQSVVHSSRGEDPAFLNTAWAMQIVRGLVLWLLGAALGGLLALADRIGLVPPDTVYAHPVLPLVITVSAASALIMGFQSTHLLLASRQLSLRRVTQIEIASQAAGVAWMLAWAAIDRTIWAMVSGTICAVVVRTVLSHAWMAGGANRWQWEPTAAREIMGFGRWIFASSILGFLALHGDRLLLGGMVDAPVLGLYAIAYLLASAVEAVLTKVIGDVTFPALSELARERRGELRAGLYRFHVPVAAFAYLCAGLLMSAGDAVVQLLYDPRYAGAGAMLQVLAAGLLALPFRIAAQGFLALGQPRIVSTISAIRLVMLFVLTPIGFKLFGMTGALWAIVLSSLSSVPPTLYYAVKLELLDVRKELLCLPVILVGAGIGIACARAIGH